MPPAGPKRTLAESRLAPDSLQTRSRHRPALESCVRPIARLARPAPPPACNGPATGPSRACQTPTSTPPSSRTLRPAHRASRATCPTAGPAIGLQPAPRAFSRHRQRRSVQLSIDQPPSARSRSPRETAPPRFGRALGSFTRTGRRAGGLAAGRTRISCSPRLPSSPWLTCSGGRITVWRRQSRIVFHRRERDPRRRAATLLSRAGARAHGPGESNA